ncbi:peptidoglycan-binding protein [Aminipila butyrica]|uniref:Peptidoglycan-binding protein n=1 Tax=Aminipila butyrica TaxID=433296 RepID=A0A858BU57_9FIRM|nr:peptidoglycan-binding protein [Aminipila butyrica]QIB68480.1 peptidoglycan-binding protein [Aminipila butyrica]
MRHFNRFKSQLIDQGQLQINVREENQVRPIDNVKVEVIRRADSTVVEELYTNSSGQTETLELAAPPLEYSLTPESGKPYSEYDLAVSAEGFEPVEIEGVQILPETKSFQNVQLKQSQQPDEAQQTILIDEHTLWGIFPPKIPEDEVKPLPDAGGFIVLPEPVIPEFIVVHLGVPADSSAQNVWVPFKDYIKNVASSEIYSTWPRETITANVLAILSFVLNRVYTEWYRGKGYEFTITNSTAYDQAFFYGRNIFQEISDVVDNIFNMYITRPGIRQPLFTQFCDGVRTVCEKGMAQWGSKELGDQGYDHLSILRNYYGFDVYLQEATQVEGVPLSFPGEALALGSTGPAVRTIQTQLNAIANNYPAIQKVRVDGVYGPETAAAVTTFQQIFNLPQNGVVDFATWYRISNIYVAVTRIAELSMRRGPDINQPYRY